jgi:polyvinyl alcohol dehydrogenase (cytochrome)
MPVARGRADDEVMTLSVRASWSAPVRGLALAVVLVVLLATGAAGDCPPIRPMDWPTGGRDLTSNRYQPFERTIGVANAATLHEKWVFTTGGDVANTPAVDAKRAYVTDYAGNVFAVDRETGAQAWAVKVADVTGIASDFSRNTPAISGRLLIIGDQGGSAGAGGNHFTPGSGGAWVFALDRDTGALVWKTKVEDHFRALITQSPQVFGDTAYVGTSSSEEFYVNHNLNPQSAGYPCCSFRGSVVALDTRTGALKWKTRTAPEGYSGSGVWGTTPSIDTRRREIYVTTGNAYWAPQPVLDCVVAHPDDPAPCFSPDDHFDSFLALDLDSGRIKWSRRALPSDLNTMDCGIDYPGLGDPGPNCPPGDGPDYDFGQSPQLLTVKVRGRNRDVLGAGQKSGDYWLLDRATGEVIWKTKVGPGGGLGGLQWGSASDGRRIYVANANSANRTTQAGFWAALDVDTGAVLWKTTDPTWAPGFYSAEGAVSVANGVVYTAGQDAAGTMFALDAATGAVLWRFASGGSTIAAPAIVEGVVYWGSGYKVWPPGTGNNKFRAFTVG